MTLDGTMNGQLTTLVHDLAGVETPGSLARGQRARKAALARQASGRRRHVDPATSERDYSNEEVEFMGAMDAYKRSSGRMFPTWSEVLEVLQELGYRKPEFQGRAAAH